MVLKKTLKRLCIGGRRLLMQGTLTQNICWSYVAKCLILKIQLTSILMKLEISANVILPVTVMTGKDVCATGAPGEMSIKSRMEQKSYAMIVSMIYIVNVMVTT